jgi:UDP-N-acetylglucosamine 2-epimerase (non-hydrolysing)
MTTVLGAGMGKALRIPVAHIEGGLRSGDLRNPFPEELNRRITSRVADLHYAPGPWAASNLGRGVVVDTGSNTVRDSLELVPLDLEPAFPVPDEPFGIVSLHRFELLNSRALMTETVRSLVAVAEQTPLLFVDHSVTVAALERFGLAGAFAGTRLQRIPRLRFFDFVQLERRCAFVVTDSGGSQQECYYLDRPCLVHRRRTEWIEGLGDNIVLSRFDPDVLRDFLADPGRHRRGRPLPPQSPGDVIVDDMVARGFV